MKNILVFGAGKSATCLLDYLSRICTERKWTLRIADADTDTLSKKITPSPFVSPVYADVKLSEDRRSLIRDADIVISLLPPALHILIALDCLELGKNLLTASYVDESIQQLSTRIEEKKLFFLCEMGLDPGIDHMSAMQIIHQIKNRAGKITRFLSHTGGLVAPETDNNPWHYKISWNPANVVKAGCSGAIFKEDQQIIKTDYATIFENTRKIDMGPLGKWAWYPNRDSLSYIPVYGLESAATFIRTTLRHPDFCEAWKNIVRAGLTGDQTIPEMVTSIAEWSKPILAYVNATNRIRYEQLGLFDDEPLPGKALSSAKILQHLMEKNWKMEESDRDMILMLHELDYEIDGQKKYLRSSLVVKGENSLRTAMAKTVGLTLGIAAKLILEEKIKVSGLHIPIIPEIYEPVLYELSLEGIRFQEEIS